MTVWREKVKCEAGSPSFIHEAVVQEFEIPLEIIVCSVGLRISEQKGHM